MDGGWPRPQELAFEDDRIAGALAAVALIRIDLEALLGEDFYAVVLILEIDGAVVVLECPDEGEGVGVAAIAAVAGYLGIAGAVLAENDGVVFFAAGDAGIERVEDAVIIVNTRLFISPGASGEDVHVFARGAGM